MFGSRVHLFTLFGFPVSIDPSWFILALLITWSLAAGYFPAMYPGMDGGTYWIMGISGALLLFISIVFHEFAHSLVGRYYGMPMGGITLFLFGGLAEMGDEPPRPLAEFLVAIAGPAASLVVVAVCLGLTSLGLLYAWPIPLIGVLFYLAIINGLLILFNLLPAFPLDGGRVLRSILWSIKHDLTWATKVTSKIGEWFGVALIILGVLSFFGGNFIGGFWWVLLGLFLRGAAKASWQQLLVRQGLQGETVRRFMHPNPITVPGSISLKELVENFFYKYDLKMYPVVENGRLIGCIQVNQVKRFSPKEWERHPVEEVAKPCTLENTVNPDTDAMEALTAINNSRTNQLMVVEGDRLIGVLSLKDLLRFLTVKTELGERPA